MTSKIFVIAGHGAGDPGASGNGYEEAERVRCLAKRIKELGGSNVVLGDLSRNYYKDKGINSLPVTKDYQIIELHLDCASAAAKGGHVIINSKYDPDKYDTALANFISGMFPGRSSKLVQRSDLGNCNRAASRGYSYRLVECCFISNKDDITKFNTHIDDVAKGILTCFGIKVRETEQPAPIEKKPATTTADEQFEEGHRTGTRFYTTDVLNLRNTAGVKGTKVLKVLPKGTKVVWYGYYYIIDGVRWYKVVADSTTGYVSGKYVK